MAQMSDDTSLLQIPETLSTERRLMLDFLMPLQHLARQHQELSFFAIAGVWST